MNKVSVNIFLVGPFHLLPLPKAIHDEKFISYYEIIHAEFVFYNSVDGPGGGAR